MCCEDVRSNVWPAVDFDVVAMGTTHVSSPAKNAYAKKSVISRAVSSLGVFSRAAVYKHGGATCPVEKGLPPPV